MSNTNDPPTLRLANTPPPERDPLDAVPPPHELRPRLADLLTRTDALRRLIRLSERLHKNELNAIDARRSEGGVA